MAPFFSTRRNAAKRNHSSSLAPSTSEPVSSPPAYPLSLSLSSPAHSSTEYFSTPRLSDANANAGYASTSPVSPFPPQLPPIPRVASKLDRGGRSSLLSPQHTAYQTQSLADLGEHLAHDKTLRLPSQPPTHDHDPPAYDDKRPASTSSSTGSHPTGLRAHGQSVTQVVEHKMRSETPLSQASTQYLAPSTTSSNHSFFSKSQTSLVSEKRTNTSASSTPTAQPAKSKSRLNLRNPMSLLMRRRSGQALAALHDESLVTQRASSAVPPIPDNYDPSIRGRIVHDFSAPRPNRNFSYSNAYGNEPRRAEPSPPKLEREHTPVFTEHFDDDTSYEQSQAAIRAERLANNDFVKRNSFIPEAPGRSSPPPPSQEFLKRTSSLPEPPTRSPPPPPPPVAKDTPASPPSIPVSPPPLLSDANRDYTSTLLSPVQEATSPTDISAEVTPRKRKSAKQPPPSRSRATSVTDPSFVPAGLPAHMTSRSSRFSFQIGGGDSAAQEKILEDRHIQKAAEKASKSEARMSTNSMGDDYDEYGMDDFDMGGGYEEEIPMLGEEDEYGGLGDQDLSTGMGEFDFSSLSIHPSMNPTGLGMNAETDTPIDANGDRIGFAMSEDNFVPMDSPTTGHFSDINMGQLNNIQGLGLMNIPQEHAIAANLTPAQSPQGFKADSTNPIEVTQAGLGDDLYFDDGMIEEQGDVDVADFDEEVFDDPEGPLFDRKVKPPPAEEVHAALSSDPPHGLSSETGYEADDDTLSKHLEVSAPALAHKTSRAQPSPDRNLNAYHSALADAANRAEAEGRFARKPSVDIGMFSPEQDDSSSISNSRPSLVPDDGRFSQETTGFPPDDDGFGMSTSFDDYDYSEFDSAMDDDLMIAEANSEALANDYEGFYGQEFGFYAAAQGEAVNAYGGFFGPSGLGRSTSGRNAMREPNLTPITERSEYSTRNSFISISHFRDGTQGVTSPGFAGQALTSPALAQLARISPYGWREEEDMSLDALMRLRKGAFGSSASLPVGSPGGSPRNSSPMGMQFLPRTSSPAGNRMREQHEDSFESDESAAILDSLEESGEDSQGLTDAVNTADNDSSDEAYEERPDSPTLNASDYNSFSSPLPTTHIHITPIPLMPLHSPPAIPPTGIPLPMSPANFPLQSPSSASLPTSPPPFPPPLTLHTSSYTATSPSLSSATATNSSAPRRQSLGLISPISTTSPTTPGGSAWRAGHSRKGSAADSVTYVREHDECGEGRWVLERRRTAESGELELVGREIVEGGRI